MSDSNTYAATMPRSQFPTTPVATAESPPPKSYMIAGDQSYRVCYSDFPQPTNIVSETRPEVTVAFVYSGDSELALLKNAVAGGTVTLMLASGAAVILGAAQIESFKALDQEYDMPRSSTGHRIGVIKLSCDSRLYRGTP